MSTEGLMLIAFVVGIAVGFAIGTVVILAIWHKP